MCMLYITTRAPRALKSSPRVPKGCPKTLKRLKKQWKWLQNRMKRHEKNDNADATTYPSRQVSAKLYIYIYIHIYIAICPGSLQRCFSIHRHSISSRFVQKSSSSFKELPQLPRNRWQDQKNAPDAAAAISMRRLQPAIDGKAGQLAHAPSRCSLQ